jgi:hypothetical protein
LDGEQGFMLPSSSRLGMGEDRCFFSCAEVDVVVEAFALDQEGNQEGKKAEPILWICSSHSQHLRSSLTLEISPDIFSKSSFKKTFNIEVVHMKMFYKE